MKIFLSFTLLLALALAGCSRKESASNETRKPESVGITFKGGKGLRVASETKKIIGLQIVEASDQRLAAEFSLTVQVYRNEAGRTEATAFATEDQAKQLGVGEEAVLKSSNDAAAAFHGVVFRLLPVAQSGQTEVLVAVTNSPTSLAIGTILETTFTAPEAQSVTAIPRSAVLRTAEGTFAYVVNGDYYFRTAVKTGAENADFVEIKDGLYSGDQIVRQPVMTLWLAELQAIKGGADND